MTAATGSPVFARRSAGTSAHTLASPAGVEGGKDGEIRARGDRLPLR